MIAVPMVHSLTGVYVDLWRGRLSVARSFWMHFILGSVGWFIGGVFLAFWFYAFAPMPQGRYIAGIIMVLVKIVYPVFAAIGTWRAANQARGTAQDMAAFLYKLGIVFMLIVFGLAAVGYRNL